ncbi:MAG: SHOCT domain-containing protein, partial [Candidatus Dormibacterales bacterium]
PERRSIDMMWGYYDGWSWLWMGLMMVLFWGGIVALIAFSVRAFTPGRKEDPALETLRKRFAGGEITQEEYDRTRRALTS